MLALIALELGVGWGLKKLRYVRTVHSYRFLKAPTAITVEVLFEQGSSTTGTFKLPE